jgi:hypothetical protein
LAVGGSVFGTRNKGEKMSKHIRIATWSFFVLLLLCGCGNSKPTDIPEPSSMVLPSTLTSAPTNLATSTQPPTPTEFPQLSGPYLGQVPPGMEAKVFAPGVVSVPDFTEWSGAFSPDGNEYYFYRFSETSKSRILYSKVVDGRWTAPVQLAITIGYDAYQPYVTVDNHWLFFKWNHPIPAGEPRSGVTAYFSAERMQDGWSTPRYAGQGMYLSSSQDGQLYTTDMSSFKIDGKTYLATILVADGVFTDYERLPIQTPLGDPAHPCIAPDGSYILFDVGDEESVTLFVSFKNTDGTWGEPMDLTKHGFAPMSDGAYISPDGKYLFFHFNGDIWWVDIGVIENLRPME